MATLSKALQREALDIGGSLAETASAAVKGDCEQTRQWNAESIVRSLARSRIAQPGAKREAFTRLAMRHYEDVRHAIVTGAA